MHQDLFIAVLAGIGGMLGWGLADFFAKKTIDEIGDVATLAWGHIFGTIIFLLMMLFQFNLKSDFAGINYDFQIWLLLLFFGILQAAVYLFVYNGFSKGKVTLLSPIFASFSGFTAFFSIIVLGEFINMYLFLGLLIVFLGILFINLDLQSIKNKKIIFTHIAGLKETAFGTILAIIWTLLWNEFIKGKDWMTLALFMYAFMTLAILVYTKFQKINLLPIKSNIWRFLFLIGLCEIFAYLAISWGYSTTTRTSIIVLISGAFSLPTILLARVFLKEYIKAIQWIGILLIIIGIMVLSIM